jgi:hypothetical protein
MTSNLDRVRQRLTRANPGAEVRAADRRMSFFADFTYEGSRSVVGPYLARLGAGALAIAVVTGLGEFLGYGLRLVSGRGADRTGRYWPITIAGTWCRWRRCRCWRWPAAGRSRRC